MAWKLQDRMVAALNLLPGRTYDPRPTSSTRCLTTTRLEALGHHVTGNPTARTMTCHTCGQVWPYSANQDMVQAGPCRPTWEMPKGTVPNRPWRLSVPQVWYGKSCTHTSHSMWWYKGILYCRSCGSFGTPSRLEKLKYECRDNNGAYKQQVLGCIDGDKCPSRKPWPVPDNWIVSDLGHVGTQAANG